MASPVYILTGASKGLGLASLSLLLSQNTRVVTLSRSLTPALLSLQTSHAPRLICLEGDVSQDADNRAAVDRAISSFGRLDGLVLNAGTLGPLTTIANAGDKLSLFEDTFRVNFFSLVSIVSHALPHLREEKDKDSSGPTGRVIFVSSGAATGAYSAWGAYSASKAAMNSLARTLANEEPRIVSVAVRPGVVDTEMQREIRDNGKSEMKSSEFSRFIELHESQKLAPPEVPGGVIAGLALKAGLELSGQFVNYADKEMEKLAIRS